MSATLPLHLERIGAELAAAAEARASQTLRRPSRRRRLTLLATAITLAATGTALAITKTNPLDWFRGGDPSREGRFTGDPTRRVTGEFPAEIACRGDQADLGCRGTSPPPVCRTTTQPNGLELTGCSSSGSPLTSRRQGERRYSLFNRIEERPTIDLEFLRRVLAGREDEVLFPGDDVPAPVRRLTGSDIVARAERLSPEFWRAVNLVIANQGGRISSGANVPGKEFVPPPGLSRFATCETPVGQRLRCRSIVNGASLPIGAPVYSLDRTEDWVLVASPTAAEQGSEYTALWRAMLGRDMTLDESIVVAGMFSVARRDENPPPPTVEATPAPPPKPGG